MDSGYIKNKTLKKELDLLITDRYPIEYFDRVKISLEQDNVVALNKDLKTIIPVESTFVLFLGGGCSITLKALERCSKAGCIVVGGNAGVKAHTVWGGGRWFDPKTNINQIKKILDKEEKLRIAKFFTKIRMVRDGNYEYIDSVTQSKTIEQVLGFEAIAYKQTYKTFAKKESIKFKRDFKVDGNDVINGRLNVLNNSLYSYITSVILVYGLNPSIGFCHGISRRGGLAFDISDIFKMNYSLIPSFSNEQKDFRQLMIDLSNKIKQRNHLFSRQVLELCRLVSLDKFDEKEANLALIFKDLNECDYRRFF